MIDSQEYEAMKKKDMEYAEDIVAKINSDPRPGILYKESRPIMDIKDMIQTSEKLFSDHVCFYQKYSKAEKYQSITYKEMLDRVNALGTALIERGLKDKRIGIIGNNSSEWSISYLAVLCGVGLVVPLDKELNADELEQLSVKSGISCVIFDNRQIKTFEKIRDDGKSQIKLLINMNAEEDTNGILSWDKLIEQGRQLIAAGDRSFLDAQIDAEKMSILLFTSGTTGVSKGVMLSHRNLAVDLMVSPTVLKVNDWDIFFSVLPLHHTYECTSGFLMPLYKGAAIAYCEGLKYIQKNMLEVNPTMMNGVPAIFEALYKRIWKTIQKEGKEKTVRRLISMSRRFRKIGIDLRGPLFKKIRDAFGTRIRLMISGGAAISPEVITGIQDFGINCLQGYGLTECAPMGALNPDKIPKAESVGIGFPACGLKIVDKNEEGIGEIWLGGGNVMLGYYEMPEETAKSITDGWFHTGDLGYLDDEGYLVITGRKKNVIITKNGKNVYPEELEFYLSGIPFIKESMVFDEETEDGSDRLIVAAVTLDKEEVRYLMGDDVTDDMVEKELWKQIDKINDEQPFFKKIKKVFIRKEDFIKNTANKIIRYNEENKRSN